MQMASVILYATYIYLFRDIDACTHTCTQMYQHHNIYALHILHHMLRTIAIKVGHHVQQR
uniref:Uncharacterized protein n=1 Tax=Picea glauca TaxID=3330 RepID=A0A124GML1_PICGL|nr:hypothetical protein ABT39_MTgene2111 [Picea glauca]QHR86926.1 hypothetical protein Q903MT_gene933 [Picea sitchensis]